MAAREGGLFVRDYQQRCFLESRGVLLAVTTVLGVLQQGVSLGHVGSEGVISLECALVTALLGLLAKD